MSELPDEPTDWARFFARYRTVVLVANSEAADIPALRHRFGEGVLFVFFNKVYKVLDEPFDRPALLVSRSSPAGANLVYRREVDAVCRFFPGHAFLGILNLVAATGERFSSADEFGGRAVGHLDLVSHYSGFYPADYAPTSGFALAVWLVESCPDVSVILAGFTAERSDRWKLFHDHEWTFEQIVQRLLMRAGRLGAIGGRERPPLTAIAQRFPDVQPQEIALVAAEVLSARQEGTNRSVDRLYSIVKPLASIDGIFRRLKPKTRKQRLQERADRPEGG
ncbi:3-deoxy-manno-octulosonate cytidylyltransferase [Jiella marina]|uniref:3-deoxy-manno-octulosonate cytidylyltransferase n=1 Tax=Jiella sp. LLJ827 TaxID=2917712 RepID=UPI0021018323|nr:3-deoxy-manno-octulosonate cytidylyltransferase [Jiella sp. LLJ827]MCQ0990155.1 3-deoxy-manno-octulosonate cytidylyltransferase [Jiella sp. LLJ827]